MISITSPERPRKPDTFNGWTQISTKIYVKCQSPHCCDQLIGVKPKHPQVEHLSQVYDSVDEIALPSQITGQNLTQFNNIRTFRPNLIQHIPKCSTRACRAKNLQS